MTARDCNRTASSVDVTAVCGRSACSWLADLCADLSIPFILGHALYMRMIHVGKAKTERIDAANLAGLLQLQLDRRNPRRPRHRNGSGPGQIPT